MHSSICTHPKHTFAQIESLYLAEAQKCAKVISGGSGRKTASKKVGSPHHKRKSLYVLCKRLGWDVSVTFTKIPRNKSRLFEICVQMEKALITVLCSLVHTSLFAVYGGCTKGFMTSNVVESMRRGMRTCRGWITNIWHINALVTILHRGSHVLLVVPKEMTIMLQLISCPPSLVGSYSGHMPT